MKKKIKIASSILASMLLIVGLNFLNVGISRAEERTLEFTFTLADDVRSYMELAAYSFNVDGQRDVAVETGENGSFLGLIAPDIEDGGNPGFFRLNPIFSSGSEVDQNNYSARCESETSCTVFVNLDLNGDSDDVGVTFMRAGNGDFEIVYGDGSFFPATAANLVNDENFLITARERGPEFDGSAYLVWACGKEDNETCYYLFNDLEPTTGDIDQASFGFQFYKGSQVIDSRTREVFDVYGDGEDVDSKRGFVHPDIFQRWLFDYATATEMYEESEAEAWEGYSVEELISRIDLSKIDARLILMGSETRLNMWEIEEDLVSRGICDGEADREMIEACVDNYVATEMNDGTQRFAGVKIQDLTHSEEGEYRSNGDNQFKVIIYAEDYAAADVANFDKLEFIPYGFGSEPISLTNSSEEAPAELEMPLLNNSIYLSDLEVNDEPVNGFGLAKIEATNVPEDAVTINKEGDLFKITWHSNFFDRVVFKVTAKDGEVYYLRIVRTTFAEMAIEHANQFNNEFTGLRVEFFFSEGTSYTDYELTATIVYRDGKEEIVTMENLGWVDNNRGGNLKFVKEYDGKNDNEGDMSGKNLKRANYGVRFSDNRFDENIDRVYYNVRYTGSTDKEYGGTFAGSGRGFEFIVEHGLMGEE